MIDMFMAVACMNPYTTRKCSFDVNKTSDRLANIHVVVGATGIGRAGLAVT